MSSSAPSGRSSSTAASSRVTRREFGERYFDIIEPFADYSFNKSHSFGYGLVAYQTAYLKANHPHEYLAALLTSVKANKDQTAVFLNECRQLGIDVLVPDVNTSDSDFAVKDGAIRFGLSAVRNVGEGVVVHIVAAREEGGPFTDFFDFCERRRPDRAEQADDRVADQGGRVRLARAPPPGPLHRVRGDRRNARWPARRERDAGIMSLFGDSVEEQAEGGFVDRVEIPDLEFGKKDRLAFEKEMLGLYVSEHPMLSAERALRRYTDCTLDRAEGDARRRAAHRRRSRHRVRRASTPSGATSWPRSCSRTSAPRSR